MSEDGHSEVVYGADGTPVTDPTNAGTYNYSSNKLLHAIVDIAPYVAFGNGPGDKSTFAQRLELSANGLLNLVYPQLPGQLPTTQGICATHC